MFSIYVYACVSLESSLGKRTFKMIWSEHTGSHSLDDDHSASKKVALLGLLVFDRSHHA